MNDLTKLLTEMQTSWDKIHKRLCYLKHSESVATIVEAELCNKGLAVLTQAGQLAKLVEVLNPIKDKPMGQQYCQVCRTTWYEPENEWHQGSCRYNNLMSGLRSTSG